MSKSKKKLQSPVSPPENPIFNKSGEKNDFPKSPNATKVANVSPNLNVEQTKELQLAVQPPVDLLALVPSMMNETKKKHFD